MKRQSTLRLIYIVDDEVMVGEVVEAVMDLCGYESKLFSNPKDALLSFEKATKKPDLIITDYCMDEINGLELTALCKRLAPEQKIILYSGSVGPEIYEVIDVEKKHLWPDEFIPKPFNAKNLVDIVRSLLA